MKKYVSFLPLALIFISSANTAQVPTQKIFDTYKKLTDTPEIVLSQQEHKDLELLCGIKTSELLLINKISRTHTTEADLRETEAFLDRAQEILVKNKN